MDWMIQDRFIIALSDELGTYRSSKELNEFIEEIRNIGNKYGFDLEQWGNDDSFKNFYDTILTQERSQNEKN